jgi:GntR family transcriptional regulator
MANPMYRQIAENLREQIESGQIAPVEQLQTEAELRKQYQASRNTVRDAIKWLTNLGLVETRPGQGTFVPLKIDPFITNLTTKTRRAAGEVMVAGENTSFMTEAAGQQRNPAISEPQVEIQKANGRVAAQLQLPDGSQVISRHQKRFIDGTPWSLQTSFYPSRFVTEGAIRLIEADDIEGGAVQYLAEALKLTQEGYTDWITVRAPEATEAYFFNLAHDGRVSVFEIFRTSYDQNGQPIRVTVTVYPTDRNQFIVNVGDVPRAEGGKDE